MIKQAYYCQRPSVPTVPNSRPAWSGDSRRWGLPVVDRANLDTAQVGNLGRG